MGLPSCLLAESSPNCICAVCAERKPFSTSIHTKGAVGLVYFKGKQPQQQLSHEALL